MRALLALHATLLGLIVAGCGTPLLPTDEIVVTTPAPPPPTATPSPAPPSAVVGALTYDETLLDVLPAELDGLPLTSAPEAAADIQADPDLVAAAERLALGLVVDPAGELAVAAVIALRPGVFSDAFWRDWRDSYDAGACAQAGGVRGNAETTIGGRPVHIGTCEAGARTYHLHLEDRNILVSVTAIGDVRRLGERLVRELGS